MSELSIIIPVTMQSESEQLASLLYLISQQSYKNFEIILPTIASKQLLVDELTGNYRVLPDIDGSLATLIAQGIEAALGKYILFLEASSQIDEQFLSRLMRYKENKAIVKHHLSTQKSQITNPKVYHLSQTQAKEFFILNTPLRDSMNQLWGSIYESSILKNLDYPTATIYGYDFIFFPLIHQIDEVIYLYQDGYTVGNSYFSEQEFFNVLIEKIHCLEKQIEYYQKVKIKNLLLEHRLLKLLHQLIQQTTFNELALEKQMIYLGKLVGLTIKL